ncbi:MAG TPA: ABC-2 family transporter protein [Pseudonocardiaceae bacterium]|nr:ABC-2 family transporter protein [Pseudonocardiaceae bacterium]
MVACYFRLIRAGFQRYATYRQAVIAGLATNMVFGFMRCAVLLTVFAASASVAGYDPSRTVTFVWIGQGLIAVVLVWGNTQFGERVRSGDIGIDLLRPVDFQAALLAEDLGRAGFALLSRFSVPILVGSVFFDLTLPGSAGRWAVFGLSVLLAVLASFAMRFLLNLVAFWLLDWRGLLSVYAVVGSLLSGLAIPIAFFPRWAQALIWATPFPAVLQAPIDVAIGRGAAGLLLAHQLAWAVALLAAGRWVLARGVRKLVIQGG